MTDAIPAWREHVARYVDRTGLAGTRIEVLPGDASNRRYVRIVPPTGQTRILLVHADSIDPNTLPFTAVANLLKQISIRVPAIIGCEADLGIIVLEDLGDTTLQQSLTNATPDQRYERYREAVATIDTMQRRAPELATTHPGPFSLALDAKKLTWELEFFLTHFVKNACGITLSATEKSTLRDEFSCLAQELASEHRVFCHRDYHSRNLMIRSEHLYVIDFQDARMGPDTYDLVSLLRDCYVDLDARFVAEMVDEYLRLSGRAQRVKFMHRFDLMSVQRHLKALGTFGYQTTVAGTDRYQADVPRTLRYLADVFDRYRRFDRLRMVLAGSIQELG